jgi:hydrogenase-1 operon protein HyaE
VSHVLIDRLIEELGYERVTLDNHEEFVAAPGMNVLFFPGDPTTVKDATDVAVVLPELDSTFEGQLNPGVVTDSFGDGKALKREYGFSHFPALVFVRGGEYVGAICRIQDWAEYLEKISDLLVASPKRAPGFSIPVVTEGNA